MTSIPLPMKHSVLLIQVLLISALTNISIHALHGQSPCQPSQTCVQPAWYFQFNASNWEDSYQNNGGPHLTFVSQSPYASAPIIAPGGPVGDYLNLPMYDFIPGMSVPFVKGLSSMSLPVGVSTFSTEFMLRLNDVQNAVSVSTQPLDITMSYDRITLRAYYLENNVTKELIYTIFLDGIDRTNIDFYHKEWRHFAVSIDLNTREMKLYVDGYSPPNFQFSDIIENYDPNNAYSFRIINNGNKQLRFGEFNMGADLDEVAIYYEVLSQGLICKHVDNIANGQHYDPVDDQPNITCDPPNLSQYDNVNVVEYAPGHPTTGTSPYNALEQIQTFPLPRYKPDHNLQRNVNWTPPKDIGGWAMAKFCSYSPYGGSFDWKKNSDDYQVELAKNWNHHLMIDYSYQKTTDGFLTNANGFFVPFGLMNNTLNLVNNDDYTYDIANIHTEQVNNHTLPLAVRSFWKGVKPLVNITNTSMMEYDGENPNATGSGCTVEKWYFTDVANGNTLLGTQYPCEAPIHSTLSADTPAELDGDFMANKYLASLLEHLDRPLQLVSENGEVIKSPDCVREKVFEDYDVLNYLSLNCGSYPHLSSFINNMSPPLSTSNLPLINDCLNDPNCADDLNAYVAENYSHKFLDGYFKYIRDLLDSEGDGGKVSLYHTGGVEPYMHDYATTKEITSPFYHNQGIDYYYPAQSIYCRRPFLWRNEAYGLLDEARANEIEAGSPWFSPFVSPNWDKDPEKNLRPATWLSFLKIYGAMGAEFYYPGNYSSTGSKTCPDYAFPNDFVWQTVMSSYAQAITSRYEDIFREGTLMQAPQPSNYFPHSYNKYELFKYNFLTEEPLSIVVVRKLSLPSQNKIKYLISGTLGRMSNYDGRYGYEKYVTITLDNGDIVKFRLETKGSNYIFERNTNNSSGSAFYQLDGWHEHSHPYFWSKTFRLEGELYDNEIDQFRIFTNQKSPSIPFDYTNFTSFIKLDSTSSSNMPKYTFIPRALNGDPSDNGKVSYEVKIRARMKNPAINGPGQITVVVDGGTPQVFPCDITTASWHVYPSSSKCPSVQPLIIGPLTPEEAHNIEIYSSQPELHVDWIELVPQAPSATKEAKNLESILSYEVIPNPAFDKAVLNIKSSEAQTLVMSIRTLSGQLISTENLSVMEGESKHKISLDHLASGFYLISLKNDEGIINKKLQIVR